VPPSESSETRSDRAETLRKEPDSRRYQSVGQLSDDLQRYLDGRPVLAAPDPHGIERRNSSTSSRPELPRQASRSSLVLAAVRCCRVRGTHVAVLERARAQQRFA
jgi:hypothetical protein